MALSRGEFGLFVSLIMISRGTADIHNWNFFTFELKRAIISVNFLLQSDFFGCGSKFENASLLINQICVSAQKPRRKMAKFSNININSIKRGQKWVNLSTRILTISITRTSLQFLSLSPFLSFCLFDLCLYDVIGIFSKSGRSREHEKKV